MMSAQRLLAGTIFIDVMWPCWGLISSYMYVTTTDVSPADDCTVNMKHENLSGAVTSETAPWTFEFCYEFVDGEAMTGEKTRQLKQEHQSLINKISELNAKLNTDGKTRCFFFFDLIWKHITYTFLSFPKLLLCLSLFQTLFKYCKNIRTCETDLTLLA